MFTRLVVVVIGALLALAAVLAPSNGPSLPADEQKPAAARRASFQPAAAKVDAYDFVEAVLTVRQSGVANPFTDIAVSGTFQREGEKAIPVRGFCDAADGRNPHYQSMRRGIESNRRHPSCGGCVYVCSKRDVREDGDAVEQAGGESRFFYG